MAGLSYGFRTETEVRAKCGAAQRLCGEGWWRGGGHDHAIYPIFGGAVGQDLQ